MERRDEDASRLLPHHIDYAARRANRAALQANNDLPLTTEYQKSALQTCCGQYNIPSDNFASSEGIGAIPALQVLAQFQTSKAVRRQQQYGLELPLCQTPYLGTVQHVMPTFSITRNEFELLENGLFPSVPRIEDMWHRRATYLELDPPIGDFQLDSNIGVSCSTLPEKFPRADLEFLVDPTSTLISKPTSILGPQFTLTTSNAANSESTSCSPKRFVYAGAPDQECLLSLDTENLMTLSKLYDRDTGTEHQAHLPVELLPPSSSLSPDICRSPDTNQRHTDEPHNLRMLSEGANTGQVPVASVSGGNNNNRFGPSFALCPVETGARISFPMGEQHILSQPKDLILFNSSSEHVQHSVINHFSTRASNEIDKVKPSHSLLGTHIGQLEVRSTTYHGKKTNDMQKAKEKYNFAQAKSIQKVFRNQSGQHQGSMINFSTKQSRRSKLDPEARAVISRARKIGACPRCRKLKKTCTYPVSPYLPCETCNTLNAHIFKMPCSLRTKINEIVLLRLGILSDIEENPLNFNHRKESWPASEDILPMDPRCQQICLTQDMGVSMTVEVSLYTPIDEDLTAYEWQDERGRHRMEMPPYCIKKWRETCQIMVEYVRRSSLLYLENLLDSSNSIIWETFNSALASEDPFVHDVIKLWSASRVIERTWRIVGDNTLGMDPVWDSNPWNGIIPVTPIMDSQLDDIVISEVLEPLERRIRKILTAKLGGPLATKKDWFNVYLVVFILLHNIEAQISHDRRFAQRYGLRGRFCGQYQKYPECESRMHAARTILAHFHHICHGSFPLSLGIHHAESLYEFVPDRLQREYLGRLKEHVRRKQHDMLELRRNHQYETDLYWCHQMFFGGWEPGLGYIVELDETL